MDPNRNHVLSVAEIDKFLAECWPELDNEKPIKRVRSSIIFTPWFSPHCKVTASALAWRAVFLFLFFFFSAADPISHLEISRGEGPDLFGA